MCSRPIFETDIAPYSWEETDPYDSLTLEEWVDEFDANVCCPNSWTAANRMCGCGGSGQLPSDVSRVIAAFFDELADRF